MIAERFAFDELHDDPALLVVVVADVVDSYQVRVPQVQAVAHTAHFNVEILLDTLECDFFA